MNSAAVTDVSQTTIEHSVFTLPSLKQFRIRVNQWTFIAFSTGCSNREFGWCETAQQCQTVKRYRLTLAN
jgi:hypothetical protein